MIIIIYLDDMMGDLAALNRRTKLPMRIIQDRPDVENKKLLWGEVKKEEEPYEEIQAGGARNQKCHHKQAETRRTQDN